jgi:hypothetical protein
MRHNSLVLVALLCGCASSDPVERFDFSGNKDLALDMTLLLPDLYGADLVSTDMAGACAGADLMNDINNCGRCGRSCGTGVCAQGRCPLTTIQPNRGSPVSLAVDASNAYWIEEGNGSTGGVYKAPLMVGGTVTTIASGIANANGLVLAGTTIVWAEGGATDNSGKVRKSPVSVAAPQDIATGEAYPFGLTTDGTTVYWTNVGTSGNGYNDGQVRKSAVASPSPSTVTSGVSLLQIGLPALAGSVLYFTVRGTQGMTDGAVYKVAATGGMPSVFAATQLGPFGIAVDSTNVYWGNDDSVLKQGLTGSMSSAVGTAQANPNHMVVDGVGLYWANEGTGTTGSIAANSGSIMFAPIGGGSPIILADGQDHPIKVVVDSTKVYWVNAGSTAANGAIMMTFK